MDRTANSCRGELLQVLESVKILQRAENNQEETLIMYTFIVTAAYLSQFDSIKMPYIYSGAHILFSSQNNVNYQ